jgi:hypothetical protein
MPARSLGAPSSLLFVLLVPGTLSAQVDRAAQPKQASTVQALDGKLVDQLPLDRIGDALILLPGVGTGESAGVSFRGGRTGDAATYLDGVPVSPGYRKTAIIFDPVDVPAPGQSFLSLGTNSLTRLEAITGPLSPSLGQGQAGVILLETPTPEGGFAARGSLESDRPFGSQHGPGVDRLQGFTSGRPMNRLRLLAAATIEGRKSAESGPGALDDPIFLGTGVDTTVAVPSSLFDPFADTVFVEVSRFVIARGRCDAFSSSGNPALADNYGEGCQGVRIPATGSSSFQLLGKLDYELGANTTIWLTGVASRNQLRYFEPTVTSVPLAGNKATSQVLTAGVRQGLNFSGRPLILSLALSLQRDRTTGGPLSPGSDLDSRDGFFLSGLEFLYDMESFPVNDELIANIRNNTPGSRRSPLDLENTSQYALVNRFRNSPYGLDGGPESGGPSGRLMLLEEKRTVGVGSAEWQAHRNHTLRAGFELTRYSLAGYSHTLTSQAYSDAFIADPIQSALYLENQARFGTIALVAGVRYDRFRSDAARPFVLDTVATSPGFMTYSYFPVTSSYGSGGITFNGQPLVRFVADEARSVLSPRIKLAFAPSRSTTVRVGVARQSQMPDLSLILSGINTDLRVTNTNHVFGNDLDMERTTLYEIGLHQVINSRLSLDASLYTRELDDQAVPLLVSYPDPARLGAQVDIRQVTSLGLGRVTGVDARLDLRIGMLRGMLGYAFQDANQELADPVVTSGNDFPLENSRPHTLTGAWALEVPGEWGRGIVGNLLRNSAVYGTFRFASGTPYTSCPAQSGNESVLSGDICNGAFAGNFLGSRLPSTKHLDLRITRGFRIAGKELVAYLDGRNLLNFENVQRVYAVNGTTSNPFEAQLAFSVDSAGFADVGIANGIYGSGGELDLDYGGAVAGGCANFVNAQFSPAAPDCVYLIRAEERFGDGDHIFTLAEQRAASAAAYRVARGRPTFLGAPRRLRIGLEVRF